MVQNLVRFPARHTWQNDRMRFRVVLIISLLAAACQSGPAAETPVHIREVSAAQFLTELADSDSPTVVNVWASWCLPCRAEAPLLSDAAVQFAGRVSFIGVDVRDRPAEAAKFISEFELDFPHVADPNSAIPAAMGGVGVPITLLRTIRRRNREHAHWHHR